MRLLSVFAASLCTILILWASSAFAQVPVTDGARLDQEAGIAGCTGRINTSKHAEIQPTQGVLGSVTTPGTIGQAGEAGAMPVFGTGAIGADGVVGGLELSTLLIAPNTIQAIRTKKLADVLAATAAVGLALEQNKALVQTLGGQAGNATGLQAGFDQNSGGQIGIGGIWNQGIQVGNTTVDLRTQQLLTTQALTSGAAKVMTYDTDKAALVKQAEAPSNVSTSGTSKATVSAEQTELLKPQAPAVATPTSDLGE